MLQPPERLVALQPLWGVWVLDSYIGEGSYGKVFRIRREEMGTTTYAALKWIMLPKSQTELSEYRTEGLREDEVRQLYRDNISRFREEIDMMNRLKGNSHIVNYEDHLILERNEEIGWDILIRMELLKPLSGRYQEGMTVGDVVKLGLDLCDALALCAKAHIIHRDIKPDNIFISPFQEYKLGDFGVARSLEETATHLSRQGTPVYMAPEVYLGKGKYDASADLYSLGLVMHRLLNRQRMPFLPMDDLVPTHEQRNLALETRLRGNPVPRPIDGGTELGKVICKACAYEPKKRYRSAEEMRNGLLNAAEKTDRSKRLTTNPTGAGLNSKRSSLPLRKAGQTESRDVGKQKAQTRRVLWLWIILAVVAVFFAGVFSMSMWNHSESKPGTNVTEPAASAIAVTSTRTPVPTATPPQVPSATASPDLTVEVTDYTPTAVTVGQTVSFHLRISNQGKGDADGFTIMMYVNGEQKGYQDRAGLVSDDDMQYSNETFIWEPTRAGIYSIVFVVDEEQTIQESDERNNETTINIAVKDVVTATPTPTDTPAPTVESKPDLMVAVMDYTPGTVAVDQTVSFHLRISNQGKANADGFKITMFMNGEQKGYLNCAGLVAGDEVQYSNDTFKWKPTSAGIYSIVFVVDEEQTIQESDERNNETSIHIAVKDAMTATPAPTDTPAPTVESKPDLTVEVIDYTPGTVVVGKTVTFHLRISNRGKADANSFKIKMFVGELTVSKTCKVIAAGSEVEYSNQTFKWKPTRAGVYSIVFVADEEQTVQESDEHNNETSISIEVKSKKGAMATPTPTPAPTALSGDSQSASSDDAAKTDAEGKTEYPITYQDPVTGDTVATLSVNKDQVIVSLYAPTMPDQFIFNKVKTSMNTAEYIYCVAFEAGGKQYKTASMHFKLGDDMHVSDFEHLQHNLWRVSKTGSSSSVMFLEASVSRDGWITWTIPNGDGKLDTDHITISEVTVFNGLDENP